MNARAFSRRPGSMFLTIALAAAILAVAWKREAAGGGPAGTESPVADLAQVQDLPLVLLGLPPMVLHGLLRNARN